MNIPRSALCPASVSPARTTAHKRLWAARGWPRKVALSSCVLVQGNHRSCGTRIGIKKFHHPPIFLFPLEFEASPAVHLTKIALDGLRAPFCLTLGTGDSLGGGEDIGGPRELGLSRLPWPPLSRGATGGTLPAVPQRGSNFAHRTCPIHLRHVPQLMALLFPSRFKIIL